MSDPGKPGPYANPQQSSRAIWIVILVVMLVIGLPILLVALAFLGCCGLLGVGAYSAFQMTGEAAKKQYENDPVIQQHIGEIQSISANISATSAEQQKQAQAGGNATIIVFDVTGTKGSGQLIAEQQPPAPGAQPGKFFSKATLRTSQGEFPLSQ